MSDPSLRPAAALAKSATFFGLTEKDFTKLIPRQRYLCIYRKVRYALCRSDPKLREQFACLDHTDLWERANADWKSLGWTARCQIIHCFLKAHEAPRFVEDFAVSQCGRQTGQIKEMA